MKTHHHHCCVHDAARIQLHTKCIVGVVFTKPLPFEPCSCRTYRNSMGTPVLCCSHPGVSTRSPLTSPVVNKEFVNSSTGCPLDNTMCRP
jgi:hypothetical protein